MGNLCNKGNANRFNYYGTLPTNLSSSQKIINKINPPTQLNLTNSNSIPDYVYTYTTLEALRISGRNLHCLSPDIGNLVNLKSFDICYTNIYSLPDTLGNLINLTTMYLRDNNLESLPNSFGNLINITTLYLSDNMLITLPESFGNLTKLQKLYLDNNNLISLPDSFCNLINLSYLDLSRNNLITLPENFYHLDKLMTLYLKYNKLEFINSNIKKMKYKENFNIPVSSYNINNLSDDCEYILITDLSKNLTNLPMNMKEIQLYRPQKKNIKVPFDCVLYINKNIVNQ
jgi:Leucine-rich repeat (LRR) protein